MKEKDTITIAPSVIITTAVHTATRVQGVARMGHVPDVVGNLFRGQPMGSGVVLELKPDRTVRLELYLVTRAGSNIVDTSRTVQQRVTRAVEELVGMTVTAVNVHIEDVDYEAE